MGRHHQVFFHVKCCKRESIVTSCGIFLMDQFGMMFLMDIIFNVGDLV